MIQDNIEQLEPTFQELKKSYKSRMTYDIAFRKQQLKNLIKGIEEMTAELDEAAKKDLGLDKFTNYMFSLSITIGQIKYQIDNLSEWSQRRNVDTPLLVGPGTSYIVPEPRGVVLVMGSWNYPLFTTICPAASAIAAGNCVLVKPSEMTPNSSKLIKKLFEKYVDNLCYRVIEGGVQIASNIIKLPLDLIIFTGSTEKGRLVAQAAAQNLVPTILELGGKSPTIIDEDANLENAALRIIQGKFTNCGQTCVAPDYLYIHSKIKEKFMNKMYQKIKDFYSEDESKSKDYPRLVTVNYTKRIVSLLEDKHEGKIVYGGKFNIDDRYVQPTIVENPKPTSKMMTEEIFGPILPVFEYQNIDEVIDFINSRDKPLALYYYGKKNKDNINQRTSSGAFSINESIFHVAHLYMPFGGVQASGHGATNGKFGFDNCSHLKPVLDKLPLNSFPLSCRFPPYNTSKKAIMKNLLGLPALKQTTIIYTILLILTMIALIMFRNTQTYQEKVHSANNIFQLIQQQVTRRQ